MSRKHAAPPAWRDDAGAAMVEFALILPLLLLLILGIIEFGRLWNVQQVITDAAREGARVAVVGNNREGMTQAQLEARVRTTIRQRLASASLDTLPPRLTITANASSGVGGLPASPARVTIQYNYPLLFAGMVLEGNALPLSSTFVMRNE